jgi:hypothetical protein
MSAPAVDPMVAAALRAVAVHEASHSIVGLALRIPVQRVVLHHADAVYSGSCVHARAPLSLDTAREIAAREARILRLADLDVDIPLTNFLIYLLAGGVGERALTDSPNPDSDHGDRARAEFLCGEAMKQRPYSARVAKYLRHHEAVARVMVRKHERWIRSVADALLAHGTVSSDEIRALRPERTTR